MECVGGQMNFDDTYALLKTKYLSETTGLGNGGDDDNGGGNFKRIAVAILVGFAYLSYTVEHFDMAHLDNNNWANLTNAINFLGGRVRELTTSNNRQVTVQDRAYSK